MRLGGEMADSRRNTLPAVLGVGMLLGIVLLIAVALGLFTSGKQTAGGPEPIATTGEPTPGATPRYGEPPPTTAAIRSEQVRVDRLPTDILVSDSGLEQLAAFCGDGDDSACAALLDKLATGCSDGRGSLCDALYLIAPEGSNYQEYGATCGERVGGEYAGTCVDL
jgi:hypothetical protein